MNDSKDTDVTSAISQTNKALAIKKGFHNLHINKVTRFCCEKYYQVPKQVKVGLLGALEYQELEAGALVKIIQNS